MAATPVALVGVNQDGVAAATPVAADAVNGNSVPNKGRTVLVLTNTDAAAHNVTFDTPSQVGGFDVAQHGVSLAAGETKHFGRWSDSAFGQSVEFTADSALVEVSGYLA